MSTSTIRQRRAAPIGGALATAMFGLIASPAAAQDAPAPAPATAPSDNAMVNLVRLLVAQHVITADKGGALIAEAQAEAQQAKTAQAAAAPAPEVAGGELPPPPAGTIRVPYVPAAVRAQIAEQIKAEVLAQAKTEGWAAPGQAAPDWTRNIRLYGDVRARSQSTFFAKTNSDQVFDFAAINNNGPTDVINAPLPLLNTRNDLINNSRLRARLGVEATLGDHVTAGIMLATGDDPSPVSTNASLGGGFGKRNVWLQKAYVTIRPVDWASATVGRFDNPFIWSGQSYPNSDVAFDPDLELDGAVAQVDVGHLIGDDYHLVLRGGALPLDFGSPNRDATIPDQRKFPQKYLFSAQVDGAAQVSDGLTLRAAAAYHYFQNLQGRLSDPCLIYAGARQCSTDDLRPFFLRKGNTLSPLRQIVADPGLPAGTLQPQPQYFGLTFDYRLLDLALGASYKLNDDVKIAVNGNYVRNLGFKRNDICRYGVTGEAFNNVVGVDYTGDGTPDGSGDVCAANQPSRFVGGNQAYQGYLSVGYDKPSKWGQWNVFAGYRYIESDAVLDAFADDDFHAGGTNAKGYFVGGSVGLYDHVALGARWLSANEVSGDPLAIDVLQIDLTAAF